MCKEDTNKKENVSSSFYFPSFQLPSLSTYIPIGSTLTTLQNEIRKIIILLRESQEKAKSMLAPVYTPKETFCKIVLEPLYKTSSDLNDGYPYLSSLVRSQPALILGTAVTSIAIPTLMIRRKSLLLMTISTATLVGTAIGLVNVKWLKEHK